MKVTNTYCTKCKFKLPNRKYYLDLINEEIDSINYTICNCEADKFNTILRQYSYILDVSNSYTQYTKSICTNTLLILSLITTFLLVSTQINFLVSLLNRSVFVYFLFSLLTYIILYGGALIVGMSLDSLINKILIRNSLKNNNLTITGYL